jgi:hypothetical protein
VKYAVIITKRPGRLKKVSTLYETYYREAGSTSTFPMGDFAFSGKSCGTFSWKSSKPAVASITSAGFIRAKKPGITTLTLKSGKKTAKCKLKVRKIGARAHYPMLWGMQL